MKLESLKQLWMLAFGDPEEAVENFFRTAYAPKRCRFLEAGEIAAAALYWMDTAFAGEKYAYIYGVATHPEYRGQGLCRKLMAVTHADLKEQGYAGALLMPADSGLRRMYAAMGYREGLCLTEFSCKAGTVATDVRTVAPEQYVALRRQYLPEGGVLQEGDSISYLATYAGLYAGDDFLMAAVHEKERLFVPELLGNRERAPQILKAMGYPEGTFRIPGEEMPFAMFLPLREDAPVPSYLGLAFD